VSFDGDDDDRQQRAQRPRRGVHVLREIPISLRLHGVLAYSAAARNRCYGLTALTFVVAALNQWNAET